MSNADFWKSGGLKAGQLVALQFVLYGFSFWIWFYRLIPLLHNVSHHMKKLQRLLIFPLGNISTFRVLFPCFSI
ncbi:unnamed protein product [Clavelina lepadiformis]|uniref:Uncharacterized protein n=1 Tax=Clavelina lepadiformis TaxID=159417 RepID=A0ABP0EXE8_CLALP